MGVRRVDYEGWRGYALTGVFCTGIATVLWTTGISSSFPDTLVISACIGYAINITHHLFRPRLDRYINPWLNAALLTAAGLAVGLLLGGVVVLGDATYFFNRDHTTLIVAVFFGVVGYAMFSTLDRLNTAREALRLAEARRLDQEKEAAVTQLKLLQAQIEPHFLFNTLANVIGLIDTRPKDAKATLVNLITLLRSSLSRTRETAASLGEELDIVTAYLDIQKIRMGHRLDFHVRCDAALRGTPLPPLIVQPLVENAVTHGVDPREDGGRIELTVDKRADTLEIRIADDGVGLDTGNGTAGSGTAIANVQQRLAALYGPAARLTLTERADGQPGVLVTMHVPASGTASDHTATPAAAAQPDPGLSAHRG